MASNCKYFDEDSVYRITRKGRIEFGLVLENAEYVTSEDEDEVAANVPQWDRMKRGHVRVAWHPKGREEVVSEKKVKLHDRSLMPGDVVRKVVKGKDTQLGYCRNTEVLATIQVLGTNCVINNVNSVDLVPLERFSQDVAIYLDSWVGMVQSFKTELTVRFPDGSTCILQEDDALDLEDVLDRRLPSSEFKEEGFYKGQRLCGPMRCFEAARWLNCTKETSALLSRPHKHVQVTVDDVKVVYLFVQGVCKAYQDTSNGNNQNDELIKYVIEGEALDRVKMINIFERCALQIGDRNYYTLKATDNIVTLDEWKRLCASKYSPPVHNAECPQAPENEGVRQQPAAVVASHGDTRDCENNRDFQACQDGTDSDYEDVEEDEASGSDSVSVTSGSTASSMDHHHRRTPAFRRGKHGPSLATKLLKKRKLRRTRKRQPVEQPSMKPGDVLVTETLATYTTAQVVWQDGSVESGIPSADLYPIHHLDGHEFFPGDFVVENTDTPPAHEYAVVKKVDHSGRTAVVTKFKTYMAGADPHPEELGVEEVSVYDIKDHPDFKYRPASCVIRVANFEDKESESTAGQVVDVHPAGKVEVQWVSGKTSLCYPQELYRIGEYDSDDLWDDGDEEADDDESCSGDESWETQSEKSLVGDLMSPEDPNAPSELIEPPPIDGDATKDDITAVVDAATAAAEAAVDPSDPQSLRAKMQGQIELLRLSMARLEETFTQNPAQQSCSVIRRLLELYRHCKHFDQLLGTNYFQQRHLHVLVERIRQRGRINSPQHVSEQITRLFSASLDAALHDELGTPDIPEENIINEQLQASEGAQSPPPTQPSKEDTGTQHLTNPQPRKPTSVSCRLEGSGGGSLEPRNICQQLCAILKARLLRAHEDVQVRFGMTPAQVEIAASDAAAEPDVDVAKVDEALEAVATVEAVVKESEESLSRVVSEAAGEQDSKGQGVFSMMEMVPDCHKYKLSILQPNDPKLFFKVVRKEIKLLTSSLPDGIHVKAFEDRMDLYSVLIKGPRRTPYEDGLFLFDFQLPAEYPQSPPHCHYVSYCSDRLNPNLYEGGKVCVSLLGTWSGKGSEMWSAETSSLLQVLVSIQGLILVSEPYYNEAGYEQQRGCQQASENSRMYNEMVVLKLVQSMGRMIQNPPEVFKEEIEQHFRDNADRFVNRLEGWLRLSDAWHTSCPGSPATPETLKAFAEQGDYGVAGSSAFPDFPLLPASRGFCLTLRKALSGFKEILRAQGLGCPAEISQGQSQ
ncbi:(E3-independent) E2 ubiquitin-conjugating enzyme isoform X2 [Rhipicephalus sanguineus]|uniref:(E3-independent) E2 ubiquitin-conjugating enzyme isoform X2 n=1 Tax=Rhipicephalus sanguineus TaxID=34632 RepID=UPI0018932196|nr:(E3-independent) E2 ubiquitin-conjugating enzyme isoform X2 [Rhipicephalus sanguineus]